MLNLYIKLTAGTLKWLLLAVLMLIQPFVRGLCILMGAAGIAGIIMGVFALLSHQTPNVDWRPVYFPLIAGVVGVIGLVSYDAMIENMVFERTASNSDDEEREESPLQTIGYAAGVFVLYLVFSYAAFRYYHVKEITGLVIGFGWFLAVGVALGVGRWFGRKGGWFLSQVWEEVCSKFRRLKIKLPPGAGVSQHQTTREGVVVPFKKPQ